MNMRAGTREEFWEAVLLAHAQGFVTMDEVLAAMNKADEESDYGVVPDHSPRSASTDPFGQQLGVAVWSRQ